MPEALAPEEVVRNLLAAWAARDIDAVASFYDREAEIVGGPFYASRRRYRGGPAALRAALARVDEDFEEYEAVPKVIRAGGSADRVLVEGLVTAKSPGSAARAAWRSWWVFTISSGLITRFEAFHDERSALKAAGLRTDI